MDFARIFFTLILLACVCVIAGSAFAVALGYSSDLNSLSLAASANVIAGAAIILLAIPIRYAKVSVLIPLLISLWRMLVILAAIAIARATKWPNYNFFVACLMGFYFPFLVLESCLSIRQIIRRSSKPSDQRG